MAEPTPEMIEGTAFPYENPLFADADPDIVVQWMWVLENVESEQDEKLLNELGIVGEARKELKERMVLGRLTFKGIISRGVGFDNSDHTKTAHMIWLAGKLVSESKDHDPEPAPGPTDHPD